MNTLIRRSVIDDRDAIVAVGRQAVALSHRESCSAEHLDYYLDAHYNREAITRELTDPLNIYHTVFCDNDAAGFSKMVLNAPHPNISQSNTTKLDRIYILRDYYDRDLGRQLLCRNIEVAQDNRQCGIWLFTWQGNERAIKFYKRNGFVVVGEHMFKVSETHYNPNFQMLLTF